MPDMQTKNGQYKLSIEQRLTRLETVVDEIKNNHLVHLEEKLDKLIWLVVASLVGVVANLLNVIIK